MAGKLTIMGISLNDREDISPKVQGVLSEFGEEILMRAGIPSPDRQKGLIALALEADESAVKNLAKQLEEIEGVTVRSLPF